MGDSASGSVPDTCIGDELDAVAAGVAAVLGLRFTPTFTLLQGSGPSLSHSYDACFHPNTRFG